MVTEKYKVEVPSPTSSVATCLQVLSFQFPAFPIFSMLLLSGNTEFVSLLTWKVIFSKVLVRDILIVQIHSFIPLSVGHLTSTDQCVGSSYLRGRK